MDNDIEWHLAKAEVKIEPMEHDNEYVKWEDTDLYKEIKADKTAGGMLHAFRMREGMSIMELAKKTGIKYTSIHAMESNLKAIGLLVAKKLAVALNCDYTDLL